MYDNIFVTMPKADDANQKWLDHLHEELDESERHRHGTTSE